MTITLTPKDGYNFYITTNIDPLMKPETITEAWIHMEDCGIALYVHGRPGTIQKNEIIKMDKSKYFHSAKNELIRIWLENTNC